MAKYCPQCQCIMPADQQSEGLCPNCLLKAGETAATKPITAASSIPKEVEAKLGELEFGDCIGRGGMGAVYHARQPALDREVAVKVLSSELSESPEFQERFAREARTLAKLNHPNIVAIHDYGEADGHLYLVMEYVNGRNLRHSLRDKALGPEQALAVVPQVCEALSYAHRQGVVHRDIKPENILIAEDGSVRLADFGIAKSLDTDEFTLTGTRQAIGSRNYMAPEQLEGASGVDERSDIYSLGVVLYEMLTGELPIGHFDPPSTKGVDKRLDNVVLKSLAKDPDRRYREAAEVRTDVEAIRQGPSARTDADERRAKAMATSTKMMIIGLAIVVASLVGGLGGTIVGMTQTFNSVSAGEHLDAETVAEGVSKSLGSTVMGLPLALIGLGILIAGGIRRHQERNEIRRSPNPATAQEHGPAPKKRLCLTGLFGVLCIPMILLPAVTLFFFTAPAAGFDTSPEDSTRLKLVLLPLILLAGALSLSSPILGGIAIYKIRHARDRLYGMPLAVTATLFYPLLFFDVLLVLPTVGSRFLLVSLPIIVLVDVAIVWTVWRAVNKPIASTSQS